MTIVRVFFGDRCIRIYEAITFPMFYANGFCKFTGRFMERDENKDRLVSQGSEVQVHTNLQVLVEYNSTKEEPQAKG